MSLTLFGYSQFDEKNIKNKTLKTVYYQDGSVHNFTYTNNTVESRHFTPYDSFIETQYYSTEDRLDSSYNQSWMATLYDKIETKNDSTFLSLWTDTTQILRKSYYFYNSENKLLRAETYVENKLESILYYKYSTNLDVDTVLLYSSYKHPDNYVVDSIIVGPAIIYLSYKWVVTLNPLTRTKVEEYLYPETLKGNTTTFYMDSNNQIKREVEYNGILQVGCLRYPNKKRFHERFNTYNKHGDIVTTRERFYILDNDKKVDKWTMKYKFKYEYY